MGLGFCSHKQADRNKHGGLHDMGRCTSDEPSKQADCRRWMQIVWESDAPDSRESSHGNSGSVSGRDAGAMEPEQGQGKERESGV
jgi:hypothetical protein